MFELLLLYIISESIDGQQHFDVQFVEQCFIELSSTKEV